MAGARPGPKLDVVREPLELVNKRKRSAHFDAFCRKFIKVSQGVGTEKGPKPLKPRPWQLDIISKIFDGEQPHLAGLLIGRGNGKTSLIAAVALWDLFTGHYGANIVVCAVDERQATILFEIARRMVENSPELAARAWIFKDRIEVPGREAVLRVLPAEAKRLEGLSYTLAILDEAGVAALDTFETLNLAQGKRSRSTLLAIGTPGISPDNPLLRLREYSRTNPDDDDFVWVEYSADAFKSHPVDCEHCWHLANPALGDFLTEKGLRSQLPPKNSEAFFRRARLCQFVLGSADNYLDEGVWDACADPNRHILPGAAVVVGFDGSRVNDSTALVMCSIEDRPIIELVGLWEPHLKDADYRVPILDVEERIRELVSMYKVKEVVCDPFGFARSIELLSEEGISMVEHPNTRERMAGPIAAFREAAHQGELTHNGDSKLSDHVLNAIVIEHARGVSVAKPSPKSSRKIDALVASIMAYGRARWHLNNKPRSNVLRVW